MQTIIKLFSISIFPIIATVVLYLLNKKTGFSKLSNTAKQIIYGAVFGALAIAGTEFGVDLGSAVANTRDASVLISGLIFGAPSGVLAGFIGAVERYFTPNGDYTRIACTFSTFMAGLTGAVLRKYLFDDKKPSILYAFAIGLVVEVLHMLMVFVTNMRDIATAFQVIQDCSIPMISVNSVTVLIAVLIVTIIGKDQFSLVSKTRRIASVAQRWLLNCVIIAFALTCFFTYLIQLRLSEKTTDELLRINLSDVRTAILEASDKSIMQTTANLAKTIERNPTLNLKQLAQEYEVSEINVVNKSGIIIDSTNLDFLGFDMTSGEQAAEFMVLSKGRKEYIQDYQPISYDESIQRKYAGVAITGGFIQVGYNAEDFQDNIRSQVRDTTKNRHIGRNGYLLVLDNDYKIVSEYYIPIDLSNFEQQAAEDECFVTNTFGEESYCIYQKAEGYIIMSILPTSEANFSRDLSIYMMVFVEILIFFVLFVLIYFVIKKLVLNNLKSINESLAQISEGNLNIIVNVRSNEEFASLSDDINTTVDTLKKYISEAAARLDKELEMAKVIQESTLPTHFNINKNVDIYAFVDTAKEVGGDFYDFYLLDDTHLAFLIADVSGKGITAAMFMMKAKTIIKSFAHQCSDVSEIITQANDALCEGNDAEMFVTCFMGIIDLENHKMTYTNAGHNPPLIKRKDGSFEYFKTRPGLVLAGMGGLNYRKGETEFNDGDMIYLYTDGVTEATDKDTNMYTEERLSKILNSIPTENAKDICLEVKKDLDAFVGQADQFDDITMLCLILGEGKNNG